MAANKCHINAPKIKNAADFSINYISLKFIFFPTI